MVMVSERATVVVPERSRQQRLDALAVGNGVRTWRRIQKERLKARELQPVDLLLEVDERLATMKVIDLLLAVPKVGRVKADKILRQHAVSPSKTIGGLSPRQRLALVMALSR